MAVADLKTARRTGQSWCTDVPNTKVFVATIKAELQGLVWADNGGGFTLPHRMDNPSNLKTASGTYTKFQSTAKSGLEG